MKRWVFAAVFGSLVAATGHAQLAEKFEITGTIQSQIDAFQADDFETAFTFASPMIKGIFGSPEQFGLMVKNGYPMVWRPAQVDYLELREIDGQLWQKVMVMDGAGNRHILDYQMIKTDSGWQINGVQVVPQPGVGV